MRGQCLLLPQPSMPDLQLTPLPPCITQHMRRLVALVREHIAMARAAGQEPHLYGAKITGGGCGGTVCILGSATQEAEAAVQAVVDAYAAEQQLSNIKVFRGSSVGAEAFGHMVVRAS